jgi:hypothetical protein
MVHSENHPLSGLQATHNGEPQPHRQGCIGKIPQASLNQGPGADSENTKRSATLTAWLTIRDYYAHEFVCRKITMGLASPSWTWDQRGKAGPDDA